MRFPSPYKLVVYAAVGVFAGTAPARAATIAVPAGGDLQAALNAAQPGDVITLAAGATYVGNFVLPNKGAVNDYITIRSSASDAVLPPAGVRITPASAQWLPKIRSSNTMSALRTATGANHWKLVALEFKANQGGYGDIIALGAADSTQTQLSQVPYALVMDRLYVHGDPALGQKRGIALHSSDTTLINSYVSDCKAIGQDSQALSGYNGPGNYLIENNYLEGATENVLFGGADPTIQNLVTSNITFRRNFLTKPLAWRDPIIATPTAVTATPVPLGGSLPAGTYFYKVVARVTGGQGNKAVSAPSVEVSATIGPDAGGATISWTPVAGAEDYLVYGRVQGAENVYWKTVNPYLTDTGTPGTSGTPAKATKWAVKNTLEFKNAQDVLIEGNVFENIWVADQTGYPLVITPRNQNGHAPWVVTQRITVQFNLVRHAAGGVNILGTDDIATSQRTNNVTVQQNVFDDLTASTWGAGSRPFMIGDGPDAVRIDHNTVISTDTSVCWLYGGTATSPIPITNSALTNNLAAHNTYGIAGSNFSYGLTAINAYMPGGIVAGNVLAGGVASRYPAGNFFPTVTAWRAGFVDFAGGDYRLGPSSPYRNAATDGTDIGADIVRVNAEIANALSGDDRVPYGQGQLQITTTSLPDGILGQYYAQSLTCTGGSVTCAWQVINSALPAGISFDTVAGAVLGTPTTIQTGTMTVLAYDPAWPANTATAALPLTIAPPPLQVTMPSAPAAQVGAVFQMTPSVTGALGSVTWSIVSGALPAGLALDPFSGAITGVPAAWGPTTALIQAQDSWQIDRTDAKPVTITVAPASITISTASPLCTSAGRPFSATLSASGGTGAFVWSLSSGALPAGVALAQDGTLSGTVNSVGDYTFGVQATDAIWPGNTASVNLTLSVAANEAVLYASDAAVVSGTWTFVADATAAAGVRLWNPDRGAAKVSAPLAAPVNYFEITFNAQAGLPYHLWMRGKADKNNWANDSVYVQFSGAVDSRGVALYRIGTTAGTSVSIEEGTNAGLSGWGWNDNSYGGLASPLYFATSGPQTLRVQVREDGLSLDQIVLSSSVYLTTAPGALKNDTTIVPR
jgi:Putative Ig domain